MEPHDDSPTEKHNRLDFGKLQFGCEHYRRRCSLRAPCCSQMFWCRHCHNEAMSAMTNPKDRHELVRQDVSQVICAVCDAEQQVAHVCTNCGVKMGEYFCEICKFYDDDTSKKQFHCDDCGICRVGGRENFFHCRKCASCYSVDLRDNHLCVENSMKNHCPICYEYMFDSIQSTTIMKCGHTMHKNCFGEMFDSNQYRCPICSKTVLDMKGTWRRLDEEIEATPMPEEYRYEANVFLSVFCYWFIPLSVASCHHIYPFLEQTVPILCNDCNHTGKALFHIFGHKCSTCESYNTRVV